MKPAVIPPAADAPRVRVLTTLAALEALTPRWQELADAAVEPNVFYEPWMLLPALRAWGRGRTLRCVLVEEAERPGQLPALLGLFPLELEPTFRRLPLPRLRSVSHPHCFFHAPLVRRDALEPCLDALLGWLGTRPGGVELLELPGFPAEGALQQAWSAALARHGRVSFAVDRYTRALFRPGRHADAFISGALAGRHLKELRRQDKRLAEQGQVTFDSLPAGADVEAWVEEFLRLEASGWKGRGGTAFESREADRGFFRELVRAAHRRGKLMGLALRVDGRAVAMKCNLLAGDGGFAFKIAFDEELARFSPGVLLELENIRQLHGARGDVRWMDSCASRDHFMANRLWPERRALETSLVATGSTTGAFLVSALPLARWARSTPAWTQLARSLAQLRVRVKGERAAPPAAGVVLSTPAQALAQAARAGGPAQVPHVARGSEASSAPAGQPDAPQPTQAPGEA